jgi:hypothetical protein
VLAVAIGVTIAVQIRGARWRPDAHAVVRFDGYSDAAYQVQCSEITFSRNSLIVRPKRSPTRQHRIRRSKKMSNEVAIEVLEETPQKALQFLRALATKVEIRSAMASCGYTEAEQAEGWKLLLDVSGYNAGPTGFPVTDDQKARDAIAELDAWDSSGFRRIHAALGRFHPEQDSFLFAGIEPGKGTAAVVSVSMLLDRIDALESSPDRAATRDADLAAIATLNKRGIDKNFRDKLRGLVTIAQAAKVPVVETTNPDERHQKLVQLHVWFSDWSETARAVITRRDYLLLMGFAKRKQSKTSSEPAVTPVAPAPVVPTTETPATTGNGSPFVSVNA